MLHAVRLTPLLLMALSAPVGAAVLTVTKAADTLDGACNADCSLREAVAAANARAGADSIVLGPGVYGLTLPGMYENLAATGDLDVSGILTIQGAGANVQAIDGGGASRVFNIRPGVTGKPTVARSDPVLGSTLS